MIETALEISSFFTSTIIELWLHQNPYSSEKSSLARNIFVSVPPTQEQLEALGIYAYHLQRRPEEPCFLEASSDPTQNALSELRRFLSPPSPLFPSLASNSLTPLPLPPRAVFDKTRKPMFEFLTFGFSQNEKHYESVRLSSPTPNPPSSIL